MKRALMLFACILASAFVAMAQVSVKGVVLDEGGIPVPGAYVVVSGTSNGAVTAEDGSFAINNVPSGAKTLTVSFIGMKTAEVPVAAGNIKITLENDAEFLDEVVVTAQGLTRKQKAIGYSAQSLKADEVSLVHSSDLGNSLAGKISGAQFWGTSGATFDEGTIVLRGTSSYGDVEGSSPIYVLDGTITSMSSINMDDIENITVLKGPSATALYGSRGANGAVVITSKRAKEGKSTVEFVHTTTMETYYNHVDINKLYGGGSYGRYSNQYANKYGAGKYDYTSAAFLYGTLGGMEIEDGVYAMDYWSDENWGARYDENVKVASALYWDPTSSKYQQADPWVSQMDLGDLTRTAWGNNTTVSFSTSGKNYSSRVSFTNNQREGIFYNSEATRRAFSIATTIKPTEWLTADVTYHYKMRKNQNASIEGYAAEGTVVYDFLQWGQTNVNISDYKDYLRSDGTWRTWNINGFDDFGAAYHDNPYATLENYNRTFTTHNNLISSDVFATLPLNFKVGVRANAAIVTGLGEYKVNGSGSVNFESFFRTYQTNSTDVTTQEYLTWNGSFVNDRLSIDAALFAEQRSYEYKYINAYTNNGLTADGYYNLAASVGTYSAFNTLEQFKTRSFFGTATIAWDDLVYLDGSIRNDIDSRLATGNNSYLYGGGSLSFMASKLIDAPWLNYWKIRASLAQVGSTISAYQIYPTYTYGTKVNSKSALYESAVQKNQNIKPTISTSYEIGTEFKMFNNRFWGDINFYRKDTKNAIISATTLPQTGYASRKMNAGLVRNQGIEIMLGGSIIRKRDFEWTGTFNIAKNNNTLVELAPGQTRYDIYANGFTGSFTSAAIEGYPVGVITTDYNWLYNDEGKLVLRKLSGSNIGDVRMEIDSEERIVGNTQPDFTGGFTTGLRYKNFSLNASFDFMIGGQFVSWTNMWGEGSGILASTATVNNNGVNIREPLVEGGGVYLEGVDADGNPLSGYMAASYYYQYKAYYGMNEYVYDRTYLKMRELSFAYQLPDKFVKSLGIGLNDASISFVATNPWLIYAACPNLDPSEIAGSYYNYIEAGQTLSSRSFGLTLKLTF